jgi:hypothetical protein
MSDLMLDIETLATTPDSTILTIGAQGFDPFSDKFTEATYYRRLTIDSQAERTIDDSPNGTVEWWGKQAADAQEEALGDGDDRVDIITSLKELSKIAWKHKRIWANGTTFDMVILEDAMRQYGIPCPWKYWQVMDARTIYKLTSAKPLGNNHNALADCVKQIDTLQQSIKQLGISEF